MEPPTDTTYNDDDLLDLKEKRHQLQERIETKRLAQHDLINSLNSLVPNLVSSLDLSLKVVSAFNGLSCNPNPKPPKRSTTPSNPPQRSPIVKPPSLPKPSSEAQEETVDHGKALSIVKSMVAICLLERVPFVPIDSAALVRKLESDELTSLEKAALSKLGGESGSAAMAVEVALRAVAEESGGVELEEFAVNGKSRVMVLGIDRNQLVKELPENSQELMSMGGDNQVDVVVSVAAGIDINGGGFGMGGVMPRPEMWMGDHPGLRPIFPGSGPPPMMGARGGPRVMGGLMGMPPRVMGGPPPLPRGPLGPAGTMGPASRPRTEEDDMQDLEALLSKKSFRELQKSRTGEELMDLIHRPTARETAVAAKFKTKGGPNLKEYCSALTKEDCRRQCGSYTACEKVHFRRIIAPHTDIILGDCSFLDTCRHMKTCKYVHYELDPTPDVPPMMGAPPPKPLKAQRAEYCSEVELGEAQWINCDIRTFRMDILGQFGVIMADPPWDIHMELPYGTMADDEMRNLNVPALQTDGLIFLWVTGRAMELGRECLELWGYKRIEEIIWVKTNQLQRIIRTGRTGHWLNHSKEHCLVGIKGNPEVNRNIDTDVIVAEVRETSRKPDEMYPMLERISPRTRKLELFARMHNTHAGWMSLGNQLHGVRLVDEGLRARFKAAYPDVEVQPASPPRPSVVEVEANGTQMRSPFVGMESKGGTQFLEPTATEGYVSEDKPMVPDVDMVG